MPFLRLTIHQNTVLTCVYNLAFHMLVLNIRKSFKNNTVIIAMREAFNIRKIFVKLYIDFNFLKFTMDYIFKSYCDLIIRINY
jgi:hypothetical protein